MSQHLRWGVVCALLLSTACRSGKGSRCENRECEPGLVCHRPTLLCVLDEPPVLTLTAPAAELSVTGPSFELGGSVRDDQAVKAVDYRLGEGSDWTSVPVAADGSFSAVVAVPVVDGVSFTLQVRATDSFDQETVATAAVLVDRVDPTCALLAPQADRIVPAAGKATLSLRFKAEDGSGLAATPLAHAGAVELELDAAASMGSEYVFTWPIRPELNGKPQEISFRATDRFGHACALNPKLVLDTTGPTLTVRAPIDGAVLGASVGPSIAFSGIALEGTTPASSVTVDFADGTGPRKASVAPNGAWLVEVPLPANEDMVRHEARVVALDANGNEAVTTLTLFVDVVAPRLTLISPAQAQTFNIATTPADGKVQFRWTAVDADDRAVTELLNPDGTKQVLTGDSYSLQTSSSDDGKTYVFKLRATDRGGNVGLAERTILVDRVAGDVPPPVETLRGGDGLMSTSRV